MLAPYALLGILITMILGIGVAAILLSVRIGPRRDRRRKQESYECGIPPEGDARNRFPVHFYLVAVLFILFDVETMFLIPWAVVRTGETTLLSLEIWLGEAALFGTILAGGLLYVYRQGILDEV